MEREVCVTVRPQLIKNLEGQTFGRLTVLSMEGRNKFGKILWKCICSCELKKEVVCTGNILKNGSKRSCGCIKSPPLMEYKEILKKRSDKNSVWNEKCLEWTGDLHYHYPHGLVNCIFNGKKAHHPAHRISYWLHKGEIPKGIYVLHSCDNPKCINPEHLHLGTQKDNIRECIERGRANHESKGSKGVKHHKAKLSEDQVAEIRRLRSKGYTGLKLADMFNVSNPMIYYICNKKNWRHV